MEFISTMKLTMGNLTMKSPFTFPAVGAFLVVLAAAALIGCGNAELAGGPPVPLAGQPVPLGPGDRIHITVYGQDLMTNDYLVDRDGSIALPLAGRIVIGGMVTADAEAAIRKKLVKGIVVDPNVTVDVIQYRPIYVIGEVNKPGAYDYTSNIVMINAVALAGGFTYRARKDGVTVLRGSEASEQRYRATQTTALQPGDVVLVPERFF
ncbi:MAG TPA: polysaccharide biosynthesis/export family protein [Stellaceae bacterium]|nr:polysaccharide biosynthesis/export family protein [Stellaceae bacterium]